MKHLDELTLSAIAGGNLKADTAILRHIEQCPLCSKKLILIQKALKPSKPIEPTPLVLQNILQHYHQASAIEPPFIDVMYAFFKMHKQLLTISLSIFIVTIAFIFGFLQFNYTSIPHTLHMAKQGKYIQIQTIPEGNRILLNNTTSAILAANNDITLHLAGGVDLTITKSHVNRIHALKKFQYILNNGTANIKAQSSHDVMHYEIKTPDAIIQPLGTEFYIHVSPEGTHVYITDGDVILTNLATNEKVKTSIGTLYTINQKEILSFDVEKYALQWIKDIDSSFANVSYDSDLGTSSAITSDVNDNSGKENNLIINQEQKPSFVDNEKTSTNNITKEEKRDLEELKNEFQQMKKETKHKSNR